MEKYDSFLRDLTLRLKALGAKVKGNSYYFLEAGNWGVLNIQKSRSSTSEVVSFTFNLAVSLTDLTFFLVHQKRTVKPGLRDWHWQNRIGTYLPEQKDKWWTITEQTDEHELCDEIYRAIVDLAMPQIKMRCARGYLQ